MEVVRNQELINNIIMNITSLHALKHSAEESKDTALFIMLNMNQSILVDSLKLAGGNDEEIATAKKFLTNLG